MPSITDQYPMEEMRRLYLAKLGKTVDGRLRLHGDMGLHKTALGIRAYYWFTFIDGDFTYLASCSVPLRQKSGTDYIESLNPFTDESDRYTVRLVFTNHDYDTNLFGLNFTTTRETSDHYPL
ncbi:hypothetical protein ACQKDS_15495 [Serratia sp. NPDC078593]|uniref:hypothetical protein n=1 Tax=unclassified Serratia (in: enterobacteria) TaxID=2647522 RepID=UPI0037D8CAF3